MGNLLVLSNSLLYLFFMIAHAQHKLDVFSPAVTAEGFCISNKEKSFLVQSHALCLYADTVLALMLFLLSQYGPDLGKVVKETLSSSSAATLGHGIAHGMIGYSNSQKKPLGNIPTFYQYTLVHERAGLLLGAFAFWFVFFRAGVPRASLKLRCLLALPVGLVNLLLVPDRFGFTYVQTVILCAAALGELCRNDKKEEGIEYTRRAWVVSLPVGIVSWVEAFACESFLVKIGGHLWYDLSIPLSVFAYWLLMFSSRGQTQVKID
eukprot:gb/GEZN01014739.1/.p1 GENE.gb/GEZN01014739.1/~~gb/GEZN01014739.1/.p1  ORF type:complete len:278 (-),score=22.22 gb/GEZN01014739.1/:101-892(-)